MIDEKTLIAIIAKSTQDECKQMGQLFASFASAPRDVHWESQMRRTLALFPNPPKSDLTVAIEAARQRVKADEDERYADGWHPEHMRRKLEALGYTGPDIIEGVPAN